MIDVREPECREALRWACGYAEQNGAADTAAHYAKTGRWPGRTHEQRLASAALSSPEQSTAIVRALLEPVCPSIQVSTSCGPRGCFVELRGYNVCLDVRIQPCHIPALILRLLACTTAAEALAALKEHGR